MRPDVYVSVDVETDGPIPGPNSMLSLGASALDEAGQPIGAPFSVNLLQMEGSSPDPDTMRWWAIHPEAWEAHRASTVHPQNAMASFRTWVEALPGDPVCVAYPSGFDFTWVYWYLVRFTDGSPFSFSCLDIKTLAWAMGGGKFKHTTKRNMPKRWLDPVGSHTHVAADDAEEQGRMFARMIRELVNPGEMAGPRLDRHVPS